MKTDDLIGLLSNQVTRIERGAVARRFIQALLLGALGSLILMSVVFGVRHDLGSVARTTIFWAKLAYPLAIAVGAMLAVMRLGRPGARAGYSWAIIALPFVAVWIASMMVLDSAAPGARLPIVLGHTWRTCPFNIVLLSVPTFPAVFWAVKSLAPTQLRLAGAVAGLLASSTATIVYCLHCPEMSPAFWSVWYAIGMLLPACIGAWLGPKLLRW
ncbi:DUF1109 domain-containing protein [Paraburkholderia caribensis]|jgi:hypothetical protein|uniref:DUF1109 domain-containing protein n=1 Tax=Paraburkholderia caribensis TaxID=75105 RepID=A0A9Q6SAF7_9BURK|nr:DUF1109 domain-containing protein [Paraburkholderia caribensis]ALP67793.1 hypothetical protein AN416_34945 [Paraburkholderia caribensis]AUT57529.1 DUF1109 domain-containing protein [Paraburkholderia caribensis]MCO4876256.1 DUF1109 domain-containing protein [Paraburkholderia caribensis]MDR6380914.1 hypothetical protein [Paraburkholderia caribensis]PTB29765.1 DUF1109 domain-containing protein [Paraburkholderia caribensis]